MTFGEPIWADDSRPADKRAMALDRLMGMCPLLLRETLRPFVANAIARASDDEIAALMVDVDGIFVSARDGDYNAIIATARKYGATDQQVATFLPIFRGESAIGTTATAEDQFMGLLPSGGPDNT